MRPYVVADVFTDVPLAGNPVAVFADATGLGGEVMQRTARELNLSETVFLTPADGDAADVRARIFTPAVELPFAGHPVLGAAVVVGEHSGADRVRVATGAGVVPVSLQSAGDGVTFGEMEQPIPSWEPFAAGGELLAAIDVETSGLPIELYTNGPRHTFVELSDGTAVAALAPHLGRLAALGELGVSCFAVSGSRVKTRVFAPGLGVGEDPATGSAAGPLAVHLARHGRIDFGERIVIDQGAEIGRPSLLHAVADGIAQRIERVAVGGSTVIVAHGEYRLD